MATVKIIEGSITEIEAQALMTLANPFGMWYGKVDLAIKAVSGMYHEVLARVAERGDFQNGDVVVVQGPKGPFDAVMFICDDDANPLSVTKLVGNALFVATDFRLMELSMSVWRTGTVAGQYDQQQVEAELIAALKAHQFPGVVKLVVWNNPSLAARLQALLDR